MRAPTFYEAELARQSLDRFFPEPEARPPADVWTVVLGQVCRRSGGPLDEEALARALSGHVPSSPLVISLFADRTAPAAVVSSGTHVGPEPAALPADEQLRQLLAAVSLNKVQAARVLRVSRPTLYEWLQGKEPNPANAERLQALLGMLDRLGVTGTAPLNARFVRQAVGGEGRSLIDLLADETLDADRIAAAVYRARRLAEEATRRRAEREERLASRGFDPVSPEQRRENLARNIALKDWPKT